jgi:hypothetical protein
MYNLFNTINNIIPIIYMYSIMYIYEYYTWNYI